MAIVSVYGPAVRVSPGTRSIYVGELHCDPLFLGETYPIWIKVDDLAGQAIRRALDQIETSLARPRQQLSSPIRLASARGKLFPILICIHANPGLVSVWPFLNFNLEDSR